MRSFPIAGLMAVVAAVAINLAVWRSFDENRPDSLPHLFFACGVMPMASLLILVGLALGSEPGDGAGRLSPFAFGFESFRLGGGLHVRHALFDRLRRRSWHSPNGPGNGPDRSSFRFSSIRRVGSDVRGAGLRGRYFSLPQLIMRLVGGWLRRRSGFTVRFDLGASEPGRGLLRNDEDVAGLHSSVGGMRSIPRLQPESVSLRVGGRLEVDADLAVFVVARAQARRWESP